MGFPLDTQRRRRLTPAILWLYLACAVAPRAVVFSHHHHGDDHEHEHAWGADTDPDHDHHDDDHVDPEFPADGQASLADDDHDHHPDHVHTQAPYPFAVPFDGTHALVAWRARTLPLDRARVAPAPRAVVRVARGPPARSV